MIQNELHTHVTHAQCPEHFNATQFKSKREKKIFSSKYTPCALSPPHSCVELEQQSPIGRA